MKINLFIIFLGTSSLIVSHDCKKDRIETTSLNHQYPDGMVEVVDTISPLVRPVLYSVEANYHCTGGFISRLHRFKFNQAFNKKCNEVSGEVLNFVINATLQFDKEETLAINSTLFVDDYKGMRIMALDGHIDPGSLYCGGDRIIFLEVALPKVGNCEIGIFQHESLLAFVRIKGKCDAFCPGKVAINYITPIGNNVEKSD